MTGSLFALHGMHPDVVRPWRARSPKRRLPNFSGKSRRRLDFWYFARHALRLTVSSDPAWRLRWLGSVTWTNLGAAQGWLGTGKRNRSNDLDW